MKHLESLKKNPVLTIIVVWVLICSCAVEEKSQLTLVENGKAVGVIVIPEKTELEKLIEETAQVLLIEQEDQGKSHEALRAEAVKLIERKWEANQVDDRLIFQDEELLAARELQEFIKKISGATLEIKRISSQNIPNTPALLVGVEFAKSLGYKNEIENLDKDGILLATKGNKIIVTTQVSNAEFSL